MKTNKRLLEALAALLFATGLCSCEQSVGDYISVTSADIVSFGYDVKGTVNATVKLGIENKSFGFSVDSVKVVLNVNGKPTFAAGSAAPIRVNGFTTGLYEAQLGGGLAPGSTALDLLPLLGHPTFSADVCAYASAAMGFIRWKKEYKDIPLENILKR